MFSLFLLVPMTAVADEEILPSTAGVPVISWTDAGGYVDQEVIVQGKIFETSKRKTICFLNFDRERKFTAIVRAANFDNFPVSPELKYASKVVRIRGIVSQFKGKPQIEVYSPKQITILEKEEPLPPPPVGKTSKSDGIVTLATYNVLNLFDEHDDPYHRDEGTKAKPKEQLEKLAETIRKVDADVLALEEVENRGYLERFVHAMLPNMGYKHVVCYEGNDRRGIDCAVLSRFPVGPVTSYRHVRFSDGSGGMMGFRRDLIRVRIEPPGRPSFDVFVVHFKSKRGGGASEPIRCAEATQARKILDDILERDEKALFAICGDFNDTWDSQAMKIIRGGEDNTALRSFQDDLPEGTPTYNRARYRSMIDFILCSPGLANYYVPKSCRVISGSVKSSGSDHNPVMIQFDFKSLN